MNDIYNALLGGSLIGLASSLLLFSNGRITGISGILSGSIFPKKGESSWRVFFLLGLLVGGFLMIWFNNFQFEALPNRTLAGVGIGGTFVGLGTFIGNGCTSGHGVCGVSRLSKRSIFATLTFMFAGAVMVYILEHVLGGF